MIEIIAVGGYTEVGRNMTAVRYNDEVVLLDMGVHLERYISFKGDDDLEAFNVKDLIKADAVPNDAIIKDLRKKVVAIVPSHGHLDHIGAIPYMSSRYDAPIVATPYTAAVINAILADKEIKVDNDILSVPLGKKTKVSSSISVEFINITHSIPDAAAVAIHTPEGIIIYTLDFKLDNTPIIGQPPDYARLSELGKEGRVRAVVMDSLYADLPRKTPSESVAKEMLREVMLDTDSGDRAVLVTTFSSHIARLKSIIEFGKKMKRKVVLLGRSLAKYVNAAETISLVEFSKDVEIVPYKNMIARTLKKIAREGRENYLIVVTGHQGEPDAVLSKIANDKFSFRLEPGDHIIFSTAVIPSPLNIANREVLEKKLMEKKVRIFRDIHQSGHASREDHRDLIRMLKPEHIIPAHTPHVKAIKMVELAEEMGYRLGKTVHLMKEGERIAL